MRLDHERVRWHRDRLGWTLDTLAEKAEVAKGTVLRAEHGEDVRPSSGRRIAKALGTEISELIPDKPERVRELTAPLAEVPREAGPSHNDAVYEEAAEEFNKRHYGPSIIAQGWDRLTERWTQRLERGDFDQRELKILVETLENLAMGMEANAAAERKELVSSYGAEAARDMSLLRPAIIRLGLLVGEVLEEIKKEKAEVPVEPSSNVAHLADRAEKEAS